jgi:hypothetical protein
LVIDVHVEVSLEPRRSAIPARRVVVAAAVSFLRSQQRLLSGGLAGATDDRVAADVARRHDSSHEAWLSTIAALREHVPEEVADQVVALYGFHGRVAGGLAGEQSLRLDGPIEAGVRRILADQLGEMTDQAVAVLETLPGG